MNGRVLAAFLPVGLVATGIVGFESSEPDSKESAVTSTSPAEAASNPSGNGFGSIPLFLHYGSHGGSNSWWLASTTPDRDDVYSGESGPSHALWLDATGFATGRASMAKFSIELASTTALLVDVHAYLHVNGRPAGDGEASAILFPSTPSVPGVYGGMAWTSVPICFQFQEREVTSARVIVSVESPAPGTVFVHADGSSRLEFDSQEGCQENAE